jgi:hypothetical protein
MWEVNHLTLLLSKVQISCDIHGDGWGWDTPWVPTFDNLRGGKGCPKCKGRYKTPKNILLTRAMESSGKSGLEFQGLLGSYVGVRTRCKVSCNIHGPRC